MVILLQLCIKLIADFVKKAFVEAKLGEGGFGKVYRVKLQDKLYALKCEEIFPHHSIVEIMKEAKVF